MSEKIEKCVGCAHTFSIRVLRYVRGPDGSYKYLCTECRKKRRSIYYQVNV